MKMNKGKESHLNGNWKDQATVFVLNNKALVILVALVCVAGIITSGVFFKYSNLSSVVRQSAVAAIIGIGFTVVLGGGGIDLSVGNMLGLVGVLFALWSKELPLAAAIILALLVGLVCGTINGLITVKLNLPAFLVTLATSQIFLGAAYIVTDGKMVSELSKEVAFIGQGIVLWVIPFSLVIMLALAFIVAIIMYRTKYGRHVIATGGNPDAAMVSGISVDKIKISVYTIMGVCAALGGIVLTGRTALATAGAGDGMEMDAIAAVVIGGTPMSGGKVKVGGTIFGCLTMGIMNNLLNLAGVSSFWQNVAKGCIIILAILLDAQTEAFFNRRRKTSVIN